PGCWLRRDRRAWRLPPLQQWGSRAWLGSTSVLAAGFGAGGFGHLDFEGEAALVAGVQRADADDVAVHFLAALVADAEDHGVFPGALVIAGRREGALDAQRLDAGPVARERCLVEAQVAPA